MRSLAAVFLVVLVLLAPMVQAATYRVTVTLTTSTGRILWTLTTTVQTSDSILVVKVPERLYNLIVEQLGTDTITTPFTKAIVRGILILTVNSEPPGLMIMFEPVPPGEVVIDGRIDLADAAALAFSYGFGPGASGYDAYADSNLDGRVDILDAAALAANYDHTY